MTLYSCGVLPYQVKGLGWEGHHIHWCFFVSSRPVSCALPTLMQGVIDMQKPTRTCSPDLNICQTNANAAEWMWKEIWTISNWLITLVRQWEKDWSSVFRVSAFHFHVMFCVLNVFISPCVFVFKWYAFPSISHLRVWRGMIREYMPDKMSEYMPSHGSC